MKFEVVHTVWGADDEVFAGGEHEVAKPSKAFLRLLGSAEAAGSVIVFDATDAERKSMYAHLEDDEDSLVAQQKAMDSSVWHVGNIQQFIDSVEAEDDSLMSDDVRAFRAVGLAHAKLIQGFLEDGDDYDTASEKAQQVFREQQQAIADAESKAAQVTDG